MKPYHKLQHYYGPNVCKQNLQGSFVHYQVALRYDIYYSITFNWARLLKAFCDLLNTIILKTTFSSTASLYKNVLHHRSHLCYASLLLNGSNLFPTTHLCQSNRKHNSSRHPFWTQQNKENWKEFYWSFNELFLHVHRSDTSCASIRSTSLLTTRTLLTVLFKH